MDKGGACLCSGGGKGLRAQTLPPLSVPTPALFPSCVAQLCAQAAAASTHPHTPTHPHITTTPTTFTQTPPTPHQLSPATALACTRGSRPLSLSSHACSHTDGLTNIAPCSSAIPLLDTRPSTLPAPPLLGPPPSPLRSAPSPQPSATHNLPARPLVGSWAPARAPPPASPSSSCLFWAASAT